MSDTRKLLLCIEDDEDDSKWIEEAVEETNPHIVFVNKRNGRDALMFLNRQKQHNYLPCLILLDINMPIMNGKETLREIKMDPSLKKIPIVVFTTSNNKNDQAFCNEFGAEVITKPDKMKEIKRVISHLVLARCTA